MDDQIATFRAAITAQKMASQNIVNLRHVLIDVIPEYNGTFDIGASDKQWMNIWANNMYLSGPIIYKKNVQRVTGNVILDTSTSGSIFNLISSSSFTITLPEAIEDNIGLTYKFIFDVGSEENVIVQTANESDNISGSVSGVHASAYNGQSITIDPTGFIIGDWFELVLLSSNLWIMTGIFN